MPSFTDRPIVPQAQALPPLQEETRPLGSDVVLWTEVLADLQQAAPTLHRYPEEEYEDARRKLNLRTGWPREQIWLGRTTAEALLFTLECLVSPGSRVWIQPDHPYAVMLQTQLAQRQAQIVEDIEAGHQETPLTLSFTYGPSTTAAQQRSAWWHVSLNPTEFDVTQPALIGLWELPGISLNSVPPVFGACVDPILPQVLRAVTEPFHIPTHLLRRLDSVLSTMELPHSAMLNGLGSAAEWVPRPNSEAAIEAILPYVRKIQPYVPGKGIRTMSKIMGLPVNAFSKLASNEHPTGIREGVVPLAQTILKDWQSGGSTYGEAADILRRALVDHLEQTTAPYAFLGKPFAIQPEQIQLGTGSVDLIKATIQGLLPLPGLGVSPLHNKVLSPRLPFAMYPFEVTKRAGQYQQLDLAEDYQTPVENLIAQIRCEANPEQKPEVIFLANPRNPLGTGLENVDAIIEALDDQQVLILDEAYIDFIRYEMGTDHYPDGVGLLHRYPQKRLLLLRTFSKSYAIAACRLGYAITTESLTQAVKGALLPCTVDPVSLAVGIASLQAPDAKLWSEGTARLVVEQKERFYALFKELGLTFVRSYANFVYFETDSHTHGNRYTGQELFETLVKQGVIIRPVLDRSARVSVGKPEENSRFIEAMQVAYQK